MSFRHALRRARVLGSVARKVVQSIWDEDRHRREYALRAECEQLEERRLLSALVIDDGTWVHYIDYTYIDGGTCPPTPGITITTDYARNHLTGQTVETVYPVLLANGAPISTTTDLESDGFGQSAGVGRSWVQSNAGQHPFGSGWVGSQQPELVQSGTSIVLVTGNNETWFDNTPGTNNYQARGGNEATLAYNGSEYVLTEADGTQATFAGFSPSLYEGFFESSTSPGGIQTAVTYVSGQPTDYQISSGSTVQSFRYDYIGSGANAGLVQDVVLLRSTDSGSTWTDVREADYSYYTGSNGTGDVGGNTGDLARSST